jgi:hypothetical protein
MGRMGERVSLLWRFSALVKEGTAEFMLIRLAKPHHVGLVPSIDPDGAKGLDGMVGGPPDGVVGRAGSDI